MPSPLTTQLNASVSPLAGRPAPKELLVDVAQLEGEYYERRPDLSDPNQMVSFGTSGHRGSSLTGASLKLTFWPSLRRFATTGKLTAPTGRFTWVRIRTHSPALLSVRRSRCWQ